MKPLLWLLMPAICYVYAIRGIVTGQIKTRRYFADGLIVRAERPGLFWGYIAMLLGMGSIFLWGSIRSL